MQEVKDRLSQLRARQMTQPKTLNDQQMNFRFPKQIVKDLKAIGEREGLEVSTIIRTAVSEWLVRYHERRQAELKRYAGMDAEIVAQAKALYGQLPADEIDDDEPLSMRVDGAGALITRVDRTGSFYRLVEGTAVRARVIDENNGELALFRGGEMVECQQVSLSEMADWLQ